MKNGNQSLKGKKEKLCFFWGKGFVCLFLQQQKGKLRGKKDFKREKEGKQEKWG